MPPNNPYPQYPPPNPQTPPPQGPYGPQPPSGPYGPQPPQAPNPYQAHDPNNPYGWMEQAQGTGKAPIPKKMMFLGIGAIVMVLLTVILIAFSGGGAPSQTENIAQAAAKHQELVLSSDIVLESGNASLDTLALAASVKTISQSTVIKLQELNGGEFEKDVVPEALSEELTNSLNSSISTNRIDNDFPGFIKEGLTNASNTLTPILEGSDQNTVDVITKIIQSDKDLYETADRQ